jgi:hypothetical protein
MAMIPQMSFGIWALIPFIRLIYHPPQRKAKLSASSRICLPVCFRKLGDEDITTVARGVLKGMRAFKRLAAQLSSMMPSPLLLLAANDFTA